MGAGIASFVIGVDDQIQAHELIEIMTVVT